MLTDAAGVRLLVDMTEAAMLSISLLARWLTKIASLLDFYVTAVVLQSMLRLFSGWASRTPASTSKLDTEAVRGLAARRLRRLYPTHELLSDG